MIDSPLVIGVAGGIGSGKSIVCHILRILGFDVYDSDSRAKDIMDSSTEIKKFLCANIHPDSVDAAGIINRKIVGLEVFASEQKRQLLNQAVHAAVRQDFEIWRDSHDSERILFVECAILCESGLSGMVDAIWEVYAPVELRIDRICSRNNVTPVDACSRIDAQQAEAAALGLCRRNRIINDGRIPLLPQIEKLIEYIFS